MSAQFSPLHPAFRLQPGFANPKAGFAWLNVLLRGAHHIWRTHQTRRQLAELDAHLLRDIGITPLDAKIEAARKPWDLGGR